MNEQDIPIEITAAKLLDWLESRKIVPKNWKHQIKEVRTKISNALNDMPEHEDLVKLLSGEYLNYFHCLQIIEILKQTEKDTRSLFGRYGSQRMTDWQQIIKLYEKESIYLAEGAQIFQQTNIDVPSLRRQRTKLTQSIDDAQQRIKDLLKSEENVVAERASVCQKLGINGINLRQEFTDRVRELPKLYDDLVKNIPSLNNAIELYSTFSENPQLLPLLRHIAKNGNTTVYEFVHNQKPLTILEPSITIKLSAENDISPINDQIDFDVDGIDMENDAIDFGDIEVVDSNVESTTIDWDVSDGQTDVIVVENSGNESGDHGGRIAKGDEAYTVIDNPSHRDQFMDELYELESFLLMRQHELKSEEANSFIFSLIDGNSKHDPNEIETMLKKVQSVLAESSSDVIDHLHRLKHSPLYADILAAQLRHHLLAAEKMAATRKVLKDKTETLNEEKLALKPAIAKLIERSKILKNQIEQDISKRYKGRVVYIYGGVETDSLD